MFANTLKILFALIMLTIIPTGMIGQEIYKNRQTFKIKKTKAKKPPQKVIQPFFDFEEPQVYIEEDTTSISKDSLDREYQQWLKHEPLKMKTPEMGYHHYIQPDLEQYNPDKQPPRPKIGYHYDTRSVRPENQMVEPQRGQITFDFGQLINKEARNRARDIEHKKRAKKILDNY
jgi:hypothetical protein